MRDANASLAPPQAFDPASSVPVHTPRQITASRVWADHYRSLGFNVVPSRADEKRPLVRWKPFAQRGRPVPKDLFERFATANMQVVCGRS